MRAPYLIAGLAVLALISGAVSGAAVALLVNGDTPDAPAGQTPAAPAPASAVGLDERMMTVAETAMMSVVTVINEGEERLENGFAVTSVNSGSGVIIDAAGVVVTNEHVVHEPGTLSVVLNNGEQRPAVLISHDAPFTDLAVLAIPEGGLRALPFGDSAALRAGQPVLAIGSALYEFGNSVSSGVVSGVERRYLRSGIYMEDLIQTDAAVNTGNSGGPLVTLDGRMVGLISNVVRRVGGIENVHGVSFAISTRTMAPIIDSILRTGSFPRPYFGVDHVDLDAETAIALGMPVLAGALVDAVHEGSPAWEAGVEVGDVIVGLGGAQVTSEFTFLNTLARVGADARVPVELLRGEDVIEISVQLVPRE